MKRNISKMLGEMLHKPSQNTKQIFNLQIHVLKETRRSIFDVQKRTEKKLLLITVSLFAVEDESNLNKLRYLLSINDGEINL